MNEVCLKYSFPLPQIDQIVDATTRHGMLSFLDVFFGYHQIPMFPHDKEKMTFITHKELYFYKIMSFGLMNIGATYQQLMTHIFKPLIGRTLKVYIDDMVVKRRTRSKKLLNLEEAFSLMRSYDMKLNPLKSAFGVSEGKFLVFMVTQTGY